jgi:hypothetical protein
MSKLAWSAVAVLAIFSCSPAALAAPSARFRSLECPASTGGGGNGTWTILERDGANRPMKPYLSSLGEGEPGTGSIASPVFEVGTEKIEFTICGHDGVPPGGENKNLLVLVDATSGKVLRKTPAPANDALQERSWEVKELKGRKVRVEARDGLSGGAFAWMGIGKIDAGPALQVDFAKSPKLEGWTVSKPPVEETKKRERPVVGPGVPFSDLGRSVAPLTGSTRIPCGFKARRLFFLGVTVEYGAAGDRRGEIEIVYQGGGSDRVPLEIGSTLECEDKVLSKSKDMRLHHTDNPFLYYLAITPRDQAIERIEIRRETNQPGIISIRGITCETDAKAENLKELPDLKPGAEEESWIQAHAVAGK